ncbi:hypothetical protein H4R34_004275 [Dimargaris verticillata]|uniref:Lipid droplet-associated perilipin protein n=1 Tax=Dimargaris verticillata TaxID=2761393 RepID=A0A9W8B4M8_9FUNG|nr:hypothetical protein H4R34_004275 [Dimargaris verticillata]
MAECVSPTQTLDSPQLANAGSPTAADQGEHSAANQGLAARLTSLPLVNDALTKMYTVTHDPTAPYARWTNPLAAYTESVLHRAYQLSEPYHGRLQYPISTVDALGCKSLDVLESFFPIITRPTNEVMTYGRDTYQLYLASVSNTVRHPVTTVTTHAKHGLASLVDRVDSAVDTWLPGDSQPEGAEAAATDVSAAQQPQDASSDGVPVIPSTPSPLNRAWEVTDKVRTRVGRRLSAHVPDAARPLVTSSVRTISAALQTSKQNLTATNAKLQSYIQALRAVAQEKGTSAAQYVRSREQEQVQRIHAKVTSLTEAALAESHRVTALLAANMSRLPQPLQTQMEMSIIYATDRYHQIRDELGRTETPALERATNVLKITTAGVPVLDRLLNAALAYTSHPPSPTQTPTCPPSTPRSTD